MYAAARDMAEHTISHAEMSSTIPEDTRKRWEEMVQLWEQDKTQPNPYEVTSSGEQHLFNFGYSY